MPVPSTRREQRRTCGTLRQQRIHGDAGRQQRRRQDAPARGAPPSGRSTTGTGSPAGTSRPAAPGRCGDRSAAGARRPAARQDGQRQQRPAELRRHLPRIPDPAGDAGAETAGVGNAGYRLHVGAAERDGQIDHRDQARRWSAPRRSRCDARAARPGPLRRQQDQGEHREQEDRGDLGVGRAQQQECARYSAPGRSCSDVAPQAAGRPRPRRRPRAPPA